MLSVDPFDPSPHREYLTSGSNCKSRGIPCRSKVMTAMFSEVSLITSIGTDYVDFPVPIPT